ERARLADALVELERVAREPLKRSHWLVLTASFARLASGSVDAAARALRDAEALAVEIDAPWVLFECARERALLARKVGDRLGAERHAKSALDIANQHGWAQRARKIRAELDVHETITESRAASSSSLTGGVGSERLLKSLLEVTLASSSALDPKRQASAALDAVVRLLGGDRAFLFLVDAKEQPELLIGRTAEGRDLESATEFSSTVVRTVIERRAAVVVTGTEEGALLGSQSAVTHELRSIMAVPLLVRDRLVGALYIDNHLVKGLFSGDEANILTAFANQIAVALESSRTARLEIERRELEKEIELSAAVQSLFLPEHTTFSAGRFELSGFWRPAARCAGDWWWYDASKSGDINLMLGDVTGHGAGPAMLTAAVAMAFGLAASSDKPFGEDVVEAINAQVAANCRGKYFMAFTLARLLPSTGMLEVWSAGGLPALVLRKSGAVDVLAPRGSLLGSLPFELGRESCQLEPGDRACLFTDGLPEIETETRPTLGMRRLVKIFQDTKALPTAEAVTRIASTLDEARGARAQHDDWTFSIVDFH
ncbi:MAG TPA: GAF domain-containing SpoIIE family protein phosphatase, partial [Myxococcota bacterium]